jgi:hypothetical protein
VREASLYPVVKSFLEGAGFSVKGEVNGCDVVAVREHAQLRLAVVEMKLGRVDKPNGGDSPDAARCDSKLIFRREIGGDPWPVER